MVTVYDVGRFDTKTLRTGIHPTWRPGTGDFLTRHLTPRGYTPRRVSTETEFVGWDYKMSNLTKRG